jgi:hypothetical protein
MTNPDHARKALAYDIPVGLCHVKDKDMRVFRQMADWRYVGDLKRDNSAKEFSEYFQIGKLKGKAICDWAAHDDEGKMPKSIVDQRSMLGL